LVMTRSGAQLPVPTTRERMAIAYSSRASAPPPPPGDGRAARPPPVRRSGTKMNISQTRPL